MHKAILLDKASKPENLVRSYGPLSLPSCLDKLFENAVADNLGNWAESNKNFNKQQNGFRKNRCTNDNLLKLFETITFGFYKSHPTTGIFLDVENAFDQVWYDSLLFKLTLMGLKRTFIKWISNFLNQRKLAISINDQLSNPITPIHGRQGSALSPILFNIYVSDIPQPVDAQVNLSQFAYDIAIWAQAPAIRSINLRLQKYLNQILTWCDRRRIKLNPGKSYLINFSQRKVIKKTLISMYGQPLKVTDSVKFLGVHIDSHLSMELHAEHIERTSLLCRTRITRLNSINATLLICLYKIFTRTYMDYACTALTALNKTQRQKLEGIQNRCHRYERRAVDSTCISNNEPRPRCNTVSVKQCILALADSWWIKASKNNDYIINFTHHHQSNTNRKAPLNIIIILF